MLYLISGGSASGKSEFAEQTVMTLSQPRIYLATMLAVGSEAQQRVQRHRSMRAKKQFQTVECPSCQAIDALQLSPQSTVLLECLSNLLANELYEPSSEACSFGGGIEQRILQTVEHLHRRVTHLVVVTNEVFHEIPPNGMEQYLSMLGQLNQKLAEVADRVVEVYYTIPILHKEVGCEGIDWKGERLR